jgi:hypothetical protein
MTLNKRLIEYRKGYKHWLKTAYKLSGFYTAIIDNATEFFPVLCRLLLSILFALTWPLWFIPMSFIDYKLHYKILKKRFADCHIELTDDYQPEEEPETR